MPVHASTAGTQLVATQSSHAGNVGSPMTHSTTQLVKIQVMKGVKQAAHSVEMP
jgi:hypothetical protein